MKKKKKKEKKKKKKKKNKEKERHERKGYTRGSGNSTQKLERDLKSRNL